MLICFSGWREYNGWGPNFSACSKFNRLPTDENHTCAKLSQDNLLFFKQRLIYGHKGLLM